PIWAVEENETCGEDANGGCDMDPVTQAWEAVPATGATFCGTTWADGGLRDTDWYELVLTEASYVSLTADADQEIFYGLVETTTPGMPDCSSLTGEINPSNFAGPCFETYVDLGTLAAGTYWFYVQMAVYDGFPCENHYRIDFSVNPLPCPTPEALTVTNITPTTADLSWIETGSATTWEYEIVPENGTPTEIGTPTNSNPVTLSGLISNTSYDFYVRAECESGFSSWTGPFNFTTTCTGTFSIPWSEGFESTWPPACWTDAETLNFGWDQSTYGTEHSGSDWAYCNKAGAQLVSPDLFLSSDAWLVFWYRVESAVNPQDLTVKIGENVIYQLTGSTSETYQEVNVSLAAYTGQTISVSFTGGTGAGGVDPGICLDDVSVKLEYRWTGNTNTNWNDPGNWSIPDVPDPDGIVVIPSAPSGIVFPQINNGITAECYKISVAPGASVMVKTGGVLKVMNP
ncbi:MAG: fibronectin type III domain-containing protein, partial [Bacteroidales bacterium]|nr:fibronectin type III domain-containing protein [Bacteroidales bacterium]